LQALLVYGTDYSIKDAINQDFLESTRFSDLVGNCEFDGNKNFSGDIL